MITKSKVGVLLTLAMLGMASPAFAQSPAAGWYAPAQSRQIGQSAAENPALTGGGSTGYNVTMSTDA